MIAHLILIEVVSLVLHEGLVRQVVRWIGHGTFPFVVAVAVGIAVAKVGGVNPEDGDITLLFLQLKFSFSQVPRRP